MELIDQKRYSEAHERLNELNEVNIAQGLDDMEGDLRALVIFRLLGKEIAADVFSYLSHDMQQKIVEGLTDKELARIVDDLFLDDTVDFLDEMPASIVKRVIRAADPETRKYINQLLMYPDDSAGSLMTIELMELDDNWTVSRAIEAIRNQSADKESISTLYVTDKRRRLEGVIGLRDVLVAKDDEKIGDLMSTDIITVRTHDDQADVAEKFKKYDLLSMPVVDNESRLVGIITIDDVVDVIEEEATEDIYKMAAMAPSDEGYMNAGVLTLVKNRVVWLVILMVSATFTGMIISGFELALAANVLLASFIPMLMDTGGNAGSQSSVSVIRGITLGEIKFSDLFTVLWKEFRVSMLVGMIVSFINFVRVWLMYGDVRMGLVVSLTLMVVIAISKMVGGVLPLLAVKVKLDPAVMASPLITTIVDALALIAYFNIASVLLGKV
ncbi:magnesium transporter MgtE [Clostridia bacterium]|nr:magnesium transporter MgtE [Clostridia bacterium]